MDVTILVPLYNEEESLRELYKAVQAGMSPLDRSWEILFVNDGSTDSSMEILEQLHGEYENVGVIAFGRNLGKSAAMSVGFKEASGQIVITMDADLQDDPAEIPQMLKRLDDGFDLVSGWKRERKDPLSKRLPSKVFNWTTGLVSGVHLHDMNCGLKAYRREVVKTIKVYGELHRYTPVLAHFAGFSVTEVPVRHHPRRFGHSKFGAERFLKGFFDLLTVLFLRRYIMRPLHLFGTLGAALFAGGFGIGVYLTVVKIAGGAIGRRPLLTFGILLMVLGVQIVSFGLLGEMLANLRSDDMDYPIRARLVRRGDATG